MEWKDWHMAVSNAPWGGSRGEDKGENEVKSRSCSSTIWGAQITVITKERCTTGACDSDWRVFVSDLSSFGACKNCFLVQSTLVDLTPICHVVFFLKYLAAKPSFLSAEAIRFLIRPVKVVAVVSLCLQFVLQKIWRFQKPFPDFVFQRGLGTFNHLRSQTEVQDVITCIPHIVSEFSNRIKRSLTVM